jgi:hypothetical protein
MKNPHPASAVLFAAAAFICATNSVSQTPPANNACARGSVCVLPNSPDQPTWISPGGNYNPNTLTVRIDSRDAIHWPHKTPIVIDGLDQNDKHLIVLTSEGRQIMSAHFRFANYHDVHLCAYFDGYQGIMLGNTSDALWCKVKKRDCWPGESTDRQR